MARLHATQSILDSRFCILISGALRHAYSRSSALGQTLRSPIVGGCVVMAVVIGAVVLVMAIHTMLPEHHLSSDSKDVIKLGMGLIATMSALVLALLTNSAKGSYDTQRNELTQAAANILLIDRVLGHYGPETKEGA